jgi:4-oxalocrotonate tautomerase
MPFAHISMRTGKSATYHRAVMDQLHQAMVETYDAPADGPFMTLSEHSEDEMLFGRSYLGIQRSDDFLIVQITANNTRTTDQKKSLYKRIAERLSDDPGVRQEDIFIYLVEVPKENWSFGHGEA